MPAACKAILDIINPGISIPANTGSLIAILYRLLAALGFPLAILYGVARAWRRPEYRAHWRERFGSLPIGAREVGPGGLWLHAVSVGEVQSAIALLRTWKDAHPACPVYVSCTTPAGRALAQAKLPHLADAIFYLPFDLAWCLRRVFRVLQPSLVVVMETEIWPQFWQEAKRAGASLAVVNGRISDRAWPRYRRARWFFRPLLQLPDAIHAQSEQDAARYRELGAPRVESSGNLKYDFTPSAAPAELAAWLRAEGPLWIAASTTAPAHTNDVDEDDVVWNAYRDLRAHVPGLRLLLAPRKPERFDVVAAKLQQAGLASARRSQSTSAAKPILLLDSIGELSATFPYADVVFVGGSIAARGGHNVLEPAQFGKPVLVGPHMENFAAIAADFRAAGAWREVTAETLGQTVRELLADPSQAKELGDRARALAERHRGVAQRLVATLTGLYEQAVPTPHFGGLAKPLAHLYGAASATVQRDQQSRCRALPRPVISIGNLSVGGSGKTPVALLLARHFAAQGMQPAVLTRGYRRQSSRPLLLDRASQASVAETGDEAQLYLASGTATVGVGPDRCQTGMALLEAFRDTQLFLLDDGMQHAQLQRDVELVLIDTLDPLGGGLCLPAGRLREPLTGLARADIFLLTRCDPARAYSGLIARLQSYQPNAPVFRSSLIVDGVRALANGESISLAGLRERAVVAFCGLGNPQSFWGTLRQQGIRPEDRLTFSDHHRYTPRDLDRLRDRVYSTAGAVLLTTAKDATNLPPSDLPIYVLDIQVRIDDVEAFFDSIERKKATRGRSGSSQF